MTERPSIEESLRSAADAGAGGPASPVAAIRNHLGKVRAHLAELHREGARGAVVNEANSDLVDGLVAALYDRACCEEPEGTVAGALCVLAVGGYARREMSIHSDIDLLFLYDPPLRPAVAGVTERLKYWLWDAGLKVGCATRTLQETLTIASEDATVRTAILDARLLAGDAWLFHRFSDAVREQVASDVKGFVAERVKARAERHAKYGESLYLLQPNVKEGVGALRDHHASLWAASAVVPSFSGLDDLHHFGLLKKTELQEYREALDFLWRVRNALHLLAGRANDQMSFELQEQIAEEFGYGRTSDPGAELPVERFMRDYYRHARVIQATTELVLEQCEERTSVAGSRGREVEEGFRIQGRVLQIPSAEHLRDRPIRLLRVFEVAQEHDVGLSRVARRLLHEQLPLIDADFRADPEVAACFLRILAGEKRVMRSLMAMNEVGLLGAYLPEWEHIVCRWQHVIYHTYTVDVHSIFLVEELRSLWRGKYRRVFTELSDLIHAEVDLPVLYLGCLLHDIGKGLGGDHSNKGADLARGCAERLGLSAERVDRVVFLVRYHLLMSYVAQRRDLADPKLIVEFAETVGDRENLRSLYLLTFADIRASSRSAWTTWKGGLLRELFARTSEYLEAGGEGQAVAAELIDKRVEARHERARAELTALGVAATRIDAYFGDMPRRYFVAHTPRQIARHALVVLGLGEGKILSTSVRERRGGFSEFIVCCRDVHGLYSKVAGVLTAKGVNILDSHVYTMRSGLALEVYRVTTPAGGEAEQRELWGGVEVMLEAVLKGEVEASDLVRRQRLPVGRTRPPSRRPAAVTISSRESDFYTIIDVSANDRLGLLHDLTRTIAQHELEIYLSKASTILDQVADSFYVKDRSGRKLTDEGAIRALKEDLLRVVEEEGR